jgi:hypothetical protein
MDEEEYYAPWEWQLIDRMANGCCEVILRDNDGNTEEMCSCDYWWLPREKKELYTSFRFV